MLAQNLDSIPFCLCLVFLNLKINSPLKKKATENSFIHNTSYPGGIAALRLFIETNMQYPPEAVSHAKGGTVSVMFDIDKNGKVSNAKIKHSIGFGCDEEALRLVKLLKYSSTKNRGLFVVFHETINISFNIKEYLRRQEEAELQRQKEEQSKQQLTVSYTVTPAATQQKTNHTYTINLP